MMDSEQQLTIEEIYEEFDELQEWDERCDYLIDLGFDLTPLPEDAKTEENRVHGCQSNVWLVANVKQTDRRIVELIATSDSIIVGGLIAILIALYSGKTPQEIIAIDAKEVFARLGLERHLSSQRRNGLYGMVQRVRELAVQAEADG
ncbi:MAG: SufE family protein [Planctomycetota bacterium]